MVGRSVGEELVWRCQMAKQEEVDIEVLRQGLVDAHSIPMIDATNVEIEDIMLGIAKDIEEVDVAGIQIILLKLLPHSFYWIVVCAIDDCIAYFYS